MKLISHFLFSIVIGFVATTSIAADIKPKSLKYVTVNADDKTWKVESDQVDGEGDTEYTLAHKPSAGNCSIDISELNSGMAGGSLALFWLAYAAEIKKVMPNFKPVDLPKDFVAAKGFQCKAAKFSMAGSGAPTDTHTVCFAAKGKWHLITGVRTENKDVANCMADINAVLANIEIKP